MISNTLKKVSRCALSTALFTAALTGTGLAQTVADPASPTVGQPIPAGPQGAAEQSQMDRFMMNHPQIQQELKNDPSLINNPQWLAKHPEVNQWMSQHPAMRSAALQNPTALVNRENARIVGDEQHGIKTTDAFLAQHPQMAQQLAKDPSLIDNKAYLAQHPELENYMKTHPEIAQEWQSHPGAFAQNAERYAQEARHSAAHPVAQNSQVAHTTAPAIHTAARK